MLPFDLSCRPRVGEVQFSVHAGNSSSKPQLLTHQHHLPHFSDPNSLNFNLLPCSHVLKEGDFIASPNPCFLHREQAKSYNVYSILIFLPVVYKTLKGI